MTNGLGLKRASGALNAILVLGVVGTVLGGCALGSSPKLATCLDDSSSCISKRQSTLNAILADPNRSWIEQRPTPKVYATGVRLFAWRKSQTNLTCAELRSGIVETGGARKTLSAEIAGASQTRIGQIIALSDDVNTELKRTSRRKRCAKV